MARAEKKNGPLHWPPLSPALLLLLLLLFSLSAKPGRFFRIRSWNKTAFSPTPALLSKPLDVRGPTALLSLARERRSRRRH